MTVSVEQPNKLLWSGPSLVQAAETLKYLKLCPATMNPRAMQRRMGQVGPAEYRIESNLLTMIRKSAHVVS